MREPLFPGTHTDNMRDMVTKGRLVQAPQPKPEQRSRGDQHWTRLHPERACRGEAWHAARSQR